jgi:hypothetical protein
MKLVKVGSVTINLDLVTNWQEVPINTPAKTPEQLVIGNGGFIDMYDRADDVNLWIYFAAPAPTSKGGSMRQLEIGLRPQHAKEFLAAIRSLDGGQSEAGGPSGL